MATTTTNLGLTKPIGTEKALVSVINGNMDIIDNKVGAIPQNESVQSQITALNNQIANYITEELISADSITINANSNASLTFNVGKTGYTPFGIIGYNSFDVDVLMVSSYISDASHIGVTLRNISSSAKTGVYKIRIGYKKN